MEVLGELSEIMYVRHLTLLMAHSECLKNVRVVAVAHYSTLKKVPSVVFVFGLFACRFWFGLFCFALNSLM